MCRCQKCLRKVLGSHHLCRGHSCLYHSLRLTCGLENMKKYPCVKRVYTIYVLLKMEHKLEVPLLGISSLFRLGWSSELLFCLEFTSSVSDPHFHVFTCVAFIHLLQCLCPCECVYVFSIGATTLHNSGTTQYSCSFPCCSLCFK